jgi:tetratricopeptide (TPR) repeat protein
MGEYLFTARNPDGRKVTERLDGESADGVLQTLQERGYSDIVLHNDDVGARRSNQKAVERYISPRDYIGFRTRKGALGNILFTIRKCYQLSWKLLLVLVGLLVVRWWYRPLLPWGDLDYVLLTSLLAFLLLFPLVVAPLAEIFGPPRKYRLLIAASAWGRWEEVLRRLPAIRDRLTPDEEAFREAWALTGLGRLDDALRLLEPFADGSRMPQWLYRARLAEVYSIARRTEDVIATHEAAVELAPDKSALLIDLAAALLRYRRDTHRARPMLERARKHAVSDLAAPFLEAAQGMLALEQDQPYEARERLERALAGMTAFRNATPLMGVAIDRVHAYLALAEGALRNWTAAEEHFRQAQPRMRALHWDDLLGRCEKVLGPSRSG